MSWRENFGAITWFSGGEYKCGNEKINNERDHKNAIETKRECIR